MSYALDINNPRIQNALANLGISEEELLKKEPEQFTGRDVSEEIKMIRFNYFTRKQRELVRQIKEFIKDELLNRFEKSNKDKKRESKYNDLLITTVSVMEKGSLERAKAKNKDIFNRAYFEVKEAITESSIIEQKLKAGENNRRQAQSAVSKKRMKLIELQERQKKNLEEIKHTQEKNVKLFYKKHMSFSPRRFNSGPRLGESSNQRSHTGSLGDFDIQGKMDEYQAKMNRSKILYDLSLKTKKDAISKLLERSERFSRSDTNRDTDLAERLSRYLIKNKTAENRRCLHLKRQAETKAKLRAKQDERRLRAQSKIREQEDFYTKRAKDLERKMKISNSLLEKKHTDWAKQLEIRNELQRLKDEEALNNAERKKRILKFRRENVMEKQICDSQRMEAMKKDREENLKKKMEIAVMTMIEKEKLNKTIETLKKTPISKIIGKQRQKPVDTFSM